MDPYENYPCPKCGHPGLSYDGMLAWSGGTRPPRRLASMDVGFLPRAETERERLYHCEQCKAEFYEDMEQKREHLYEEHAGGSYTFDRMTGTWIAKTTGGGSGE